MTSLYSLEAILNLPDQLLEAVGLELLVELLDAVLDRLVQLNGLGLRDGQVAHELGAVLPVAQDVVVALFFQNLGINFRSVICATVASGRLAVKLRLRALL
jgi:hypothetical protein